MKIKRAPKRGLWTPLQVTTLQNSLLASPQASIPTILAPFIPPFPQNGDKSGQVPHWPLLRTDLHAWIPILNHLDDVLAENIASYDLDGYQPSDFTPQTEATVIAILKFEKAVLDNTNNRRIYNSLDRIYALLRSRSLPVLLHSLRLLHRLCQWKREQQERHDLPPFPPDGHPPATTEADTFAEDWASWYGVESALQALAVGWENAIGAPSGGNPASLDGRSGEDDLGLAVKVNELRNLVVLGADGRPPPTGLLGGAQDVAFSYYRTSTGQTNETGEAGTAQEAKGKEKEGKQGDASAAASTAVTPAKGLKAKGKDKDRTPSANVTFATPSVSVSQPSAATEGLQRVILPSHLFSATPSSSSAILESPSSTRTTDPMSMSIDEESSLAASGATSVEHDPTKSATDVFLDYLDLHPDIPKHDRLRLLMTVRVGMAVRVCVRSRTTAEDPFATSSKGKGKQKEATELPPLSATDEAVEQEGLRRRRELLEIRLYAIACSSLIIRDPLQPFLLLEDEPNLIAQLAELLRPTSPRSPSSAALTTVPLDVQAAALHAMYGIVSHEDQVTDVTSALGSGMNHGILMSAVRKLARDLDLDKYELAYDYVDAMMSLVDRLAMVAFVPPLVEVIKNLGPGRLQIVTRAMQQIESFLSNYPYQAVVPFSQSGGPQTYVDALKSQLDEYLTRYAARPESTNPTIGMLSYPEHWFLKTCLKAISKMIRYSGAREGFRNLIDTSLLTSLKVIIQSGRVFGSTVLFSHAVNILGLFINNEPTSFAIIQEAGIIDSFCDAVEAHIEPSADVLIAIPEAIRSFSLTEQGAEIVSKRQTLKKYMAAIASDEHLGVLSHPTQSRDVNGHTELTAGRIGSLIGELVRHIPAFETAVHDSVSDLLSNIALKAKNYVADTERAAGCYLRSVPPLDGKPDQAASKVRDDSGMLSQVEIVCQFLAAFMQDMAPNPDFANAHVLGPVTDLRTLPLRSSPGNDAHRRTSTTLVKFLASISGSAFLKVLLERVKELQILRDPRWHNISDDSRTVALLVPKDNVDEINAVIRELLSAKALFSVLHDVQRQVFVARIGGDRTVDRNAILAFLKYTEPTAEGGSEPMSVGAQLLRLHSVLLWEVSVLATRNNELQRMARQHSALQSSAASNAASSLLSPRGTAHPATTTGAVAPASQVLDINSTAVATSMGLQPSERGASEVGSASSQQPITSQPADASSGATQQALSRAEVHELQTKLQNATDLLTLLRPTADLISEIFDEMIKASPRISPEISEDDQPTSNIGDAIGKLMVKSLVPPKSNDAQVDLTFVTLLFGWLHRLLLESSRTAAGAPRYSLLSSFEKHGGVRGVASLFAVFTDHAQSVESNVIESLPPQSKSKYFSVFGGLQVALGFVDKLLGPSRRDTLPTGKADTMLRVKAGILPSIALIWNAPWLALSTVMVVRTVSQTVLQSAVVTPGDNNAVFMAEMGISPERASQALELHQGDLTRAITWALSDAPADANDSSEGGDVEMSTSIPEPPSIRSSEVTSLTEVRSALEKIKTELRDQYLARAFDMAQHHTVLVHDIRDAFDKKFPLSFSTTPAENAVEALCADLRSKIVDRSLPSDADQFASARLTVLAVIAGEYASGHDSLSFDQQLATVIETVSALFEAALQRADAQTSQAT